MTWSAEKSENFRRRIQAAVEERLQATGLSARKVSLAVVGHDGMIKEIRAGRIPSADRLEALFEHLGLEFYVGEPRDERRELNPTSPFRIDGEVYAHIPVHEASLGAGPGRQNLGLDVIDHLAFRRDWLQRMGVSSNAAVIAGVAGDSMAPTIQHGDVVLIDTARADPPAKRRASTDKRPAPIYALLDEGLARVKRLELAAPSTLALLSDNPATPPDFRPLDRVSIIGRVLWWGHTNRE